MFTQLVLLTHTCSGNESALIEEKMHSDHSANFSGTVNGAERTAPSSVVGTNSKEWSPPEASVQPSRRSTSLSLSRQEPFGLTVIVGGTNVRYCLSHLHSREPATQAFKWQALRDEYDGTPDARLVRFEDSHNFTYRQLAKRCEEFVRGQFERPDQPFEAENLSALTFSMAGMVEGDGIGAHVTTTNTLLTIRREAFGERFVAELQHRMPKLSLKDTTVRVLNDAEAGLEGELYFNKIDRELVTLFMIFGTGLGCACTKDGFPELGHIVVLDTNTKKFRLLTQEERVAIIGPDGAFKPLKGLIFAENVAAGPWTAIGFVKDLARHEPQLLTVFADHIAATERAAAEKAAAENPGGPPVEVRSSGEIFRELKVIERFKNRERHLWAGYAKESTLRGINSLIFDRENCDLANRTKSFGNFDAVKATDPKLALDVMAEKRWKLFYDIVGKISGVVYQGMVQEGLDPHKFIAGGGIGELSNRYNPDLRQQAIELVRKGGDLPEGLFDFSRLSPTARESAPSYQKVVETGHKLAH